LGVKKKHALKKRCLREKGHPKRTSIRVAGKKSFNMGVAKRSGIATSQGPDEITWPAGKSSLDESGTWGAVNGGR